VCAESKDPKTLVEAVRYFADEEVAHRFVASLRWPDGKPACPKCGVIDEHYYLKTRRLWRCKACRKQFSIKVGTIFEDSPIGLSKWLPAMWMLANCKNGISSYELGRALGVTQKTAWFMLHRVRLAMQSESFTKLDGHVEVDETYIGGLARNMHHNRRKRAIKGTGGMGKAAVIGLLERHGKDGSQVRTKVLKGLRKRHLQAVIKEHVAKDAEVMTDAHWSYRGLDEHYIHKVIDHAEKYVDGNVHTNGLENFWSLLKRSIKGTYVAVEPFHLFRYLDEQAFRFNARKWSDRERFMFALGSVIHRRLTYQALTGGLLSETC
jgi:transposase-like protein